VAVSEALPPARVMARVGRRAAFEVVVDGVLVHSKLATSRFPDFRAVVAMVVGVEEGRPAEVIDTMEATCCWSAVQ